MSVFVVVSSPNSLSFTQARLSDVSSDSDRFEISHGVWAVDMKNIIMPKDVVDKLVHHGEAPSGLVVFPLSAYWGFHDAALWQWLSEHGL